MPRTSSGGVVPPLLVQQEALMDHVEGPLLPSRCRKAPILLQRFDASLAVVRACRMHGVARQALLLVQALFEQAALLAWGKTQVQRPVIPGQQTRRRRQATSAACTPSVGERLQNIGAAVLNRSRHGRVMHGSNIHLRLLILQVTYYYLSAYKKRCNRLLSDE
jgi:hypothetical protein